MGRPLIPAFVKDCNGASSGCHQAKAYAWMCLLVIGLIRRHNLPCEWNHWRGFYNGLRSSVLKCRKHCCSATHLFTQTSAGSQVGSSGPAALRRRLDSPGLLTDTATSLLQRGHRIPYRCTSTIVRAFHRGRSLIETQRIADSSSSDMFTTYKGLRTLLLVTVPNSPHPIHTLSLSPLWF